MKQLITFVIASVISFSTFATVNPIRFLANAHDIFKNSAALKIDLKAGGKVSISWVAGVETTSTYYSIEKSVNDGAFKTVAILMGESHDSYFFRDKVNEIPGNVLYRVVTMDNNTEINTLTQNVVVL
jgi:hypothetical protein